VSSSNGITGYDSCHAGSIMPRKVSRIAGAGKGTIRSTPQTEPDEIAVLAARSGVRE
jgi:hypothetical protein